MCHYESVAEKCRSSSLENREAVLGLFAYWYLRSSLRAKSLGAFQSINKAQASVEVSQQGLQTEITA